MKTRLCVKCSYSYVPLKNGVWVLEMMQGNTLPYKLWRADLLECPECGNRIVSGFGNAAIEHYDTGFEDLLKSIKQDKLQTLYVWKERLI